MENIWSKCCPVVPCICASGVTEAGRKGAAIALPWKVFGTTPGEIGLKGKLGCRPRGSQELLGGR